MKRESDCNVFSHVRGVVRGLWAVFGMAVIVPAHAQIVAYKGAPAGQPPTVLVTPNGVPLVNIRTPNASGLSHNSYTRFDVPAQGTVLNNSPDNVRTQLGGWVQGNPWLAAGSARVILNEVYSNAPSLLQGFIEVAGQRAQVVVANPAGISCNGCGFINAGRATLAAGTPVIGAGGNLDGYRVEGGNLIIGGAGLDASGADYTDLIARAVQVNAGIWAGQLAVVTGANRVDAATHAATPIAGSGAAPVFAIDVAQLGGMYAGKITLVGTEAGVGVRNAGRIGAGVGEVRITIDGRLENAGSIAATGDIAVAAAGGIDNTGSVYARRNLSVSTAGNIDHHGAGALLAAGNDVSLNAAGADSQVVGDGAAVLAAGLDADGTLAGSGRLEVQAGDRIVLGGRQVAGGDIVLSARRLDLTGADSSGSDIRLTASAGDIDLSGASTVASGALAARAAGNLIHANAVTKAGKLEFAADTIDNRGLIDGGDTRIDAATLNNLGTGRIYGDHLAIAATTVNNLAADGNAPVIAARDRLDLGVGTLANGGGALIFSAGDLAIGGGLEANNRAIGQAAAIDNVGSTIEALGDLSIQAGSLANRRESIAIQRVLLGTESRSYTRCLDGADCDYIAYLTDTTTRYEDRADSMTPAALILAGSRMQIQAGTIDNQYSTIQSGGDMTLTGGSLANTGAQLYLQTDVTTSGYYRHWGRSPKPMGTSYSSTQTLIGSVDGQISAGGTLTGGFTDRIDNVTVRQNTAPVVAGSGTSLDPHGTAPSAAIDGSVPNNALYRANSDPTARYLVETDARFADYRTWLGSDYLLSALGVDPAATQKRLGDGFYEQRLIREQVARLTGRRFLDGYADDEAQYMALMNAGVTFAQAHGLVPGIALSDAQIAQLTSDIVWLVEQEVTLPDGGTAKVLVPQVYARIKAGDLAPSGALLAGENVRLETAGDLVTGGTIAGRRLVSLDAENLRNLRGLVQGGEIAARARADLQSQGGVFAARERLEVAAGRDLTIESSTVDQSYRNQGVVRAEADKTVIDRVAGLYITGDNGTLLASAGRDATLLGAAVASAGDARIAAGNDLTLGTVTETSRAATVARKGYWRNQQSTETGTGIEAAGDIALSAGHDLTARAAQVTSEGGTLLAGAGDDLKIEAGAAASATETYRKSSKSGLFGSSSKTRRDTVSTTAALSGGFEGETVALLAGRDLGVVGGNVVSDSGTTLAAGRDVSIAAATDTRAETHLLKQKKSGVFSSGGAGLTLGSQKLSVDQKGAKVTAVASTVGSVQGDVRIAAGESYKQAGSDILAPGGDIRIAAKTIDIVEARETARSQTETKFKQSGLTVAVSNPVITAVQTAQEMADAAQDTDDGRMKLLAAANTALSAKTAYDAVKAGQAVKDGTLADQAGGIGINVSIGSSKSRSRSTQNSDSARGSTLAAGQDVTLLATGGGQDSDLTLQGAQVQAGRNVLLAAADEIRLLAARNTASQRSDNRSSSASLGVSFNTTTGFSATASASRGKGQANGADLSHLTTKLGAGEAATLLSGGDAALQGATIQAPRIEADIGGDLLIQSLQDKSTYDSQQNSAGFSLSVPIGAGTLGGSVGGGKSKVTSDYRSVAEQSGLKAGDGGFQIDVQGDTALIGGAITSTQEAIDDHQNAFQTGGSLTLTDLRNQADYEGKAASLNIGTGISADGKLVPQGTGAGVGETQGSAQSMTLAAISGIAGNKDARTGDTETGIKPIFDANKVQKEIDAQVKIVQTFNSLAPKAADDYAKNKVASLKQQAEVEPDPDKKAALLDEANKWAPNGSYNIAMNVIIGAAGGNLDSAVAKETLSWAANEMRQAMIEDSTKFKGICDAQGNCISNMSGQSVGVNGDGKKIAGGRIVLEAWCAEGRCEKDPTTATGYKQNPDGTVKFNPTDKEGNTISLAQFIEQNQGWRSELGGHQGGKGQIALLGIQFNYEKGTFWDKLAEAYAGSHDKLNSIIWYDSLGNSKNLDQTILGNIGEITNMTNVVVATPFALSVLLPPEVWNVISTLAKNR